MAPNKVCTKTDGDDMDNVKLDTGDCEPLYNLSSPGLSLVDDTYDNGTDEAISAYYSELNKDVPPTLPKRQSTARTFESPYHYEEPLDTRTVMNLAYSGELEIDDSTADKNDKKYMNQYKIVVFLLGLMALSFVGGLAGGAVMQNTAQPAEADLTPASKTVAFSATQPLTETESPCVQCIKLDQPSCTCEDGMVVFSMQRPKDDSCWIVANGTDGGPDMMQLGGLYLRAGPEEAVGTVLHSATSAANLTVQTKTTLNETSFGNIVGDIDTGLENPLYWRLSKQSIAASHGSYRGWKIRPTATSESSIQSTESETRPVSLVLLPLVCRNPKKA